MPFPINDLT